MGQMKKKSIQRLAAAAFAAVFAAAAAAAVGETFASNQWKLWASDQMTAGQVSVKVACQTSQGQPIYDPVTDFSYYKHEVSFQNVSQTTPVLIRMRWEDHLEKLSLREEPLYAIPTGVRGMDGEELDQSVMEKLWAEDFDQNWSLNPDDGWYYYGYVLEPGNTSNGETPTALVGFTNNEWIQTYCANWYKEMQYQLDFAVEAVQFSDSGNTKNREQVNWDASKTVFGTAAKLTGRVDGLGRRQVLWEFEDQSGADLGEQGE